MARTTQRNHEIFLAYKLGVSLDDLAEKYGLKHRTLAILLSVEQDRLDSSHARNYTALTRRDDL